MAGIPIAETSITCVENYPPYRKLPAPGPSWPPGCANPSWVLIGLVRSRDVGVDRTITGDHS